MERYIPFFETIKKVKVVRDGKKKIIKKTDRDGYKIVDGKEIKMSPKELKNRSKSAKKGAKKAKTKSSHANMQRKKSMKKRECFDNYVSVFIGEDE